MFRIWSAGCATGEEAYTAAIVLHEGGLAGRSHVLGTDLCRAALLTAREARYRSWSFRGVDAEVVRRHFRNDGEDHVLNDQIRRHVAFELHNLLADPSPPAALGGCADVILCRNVLIYMAPDAVVEVAARLFASLSPGGWLITGPSDPLLSSAAPFETIATEQGVFYRRPHVVRSGAPERAAPEPVARSAGEPRAFARVPRSIEEDARAAHVAGDWARVVELASRPNAGAALCALGVQAAANLRGTVEAERLCADGVARHPLSTELHYLRALLLSDLGRRAEAAAEARRVLFLDRSCVVAHLLLGSLARARGDLDGAARAYSNAREAGALRPREEPVPLGDGERAGRLVEISDAHLQSLAPESEAR